MKCKMTRLEILLFPSFDTLMQSSYLALIKPGFAFDQILDFLDKEFQILVKIIRTKTILDYTFKGIKVNFTHFDQGQIVLASLTGWTINMDRQHMETFVKWVERDLDERRMSWREMIKIGNRSYQVVQYNRNPDDSISKEMRRRHKKDPRYLELITETNKHL